MDDVDTLILWFKVHTLASAAALPLACWVTAGVSSAAHFIQDVFSNLIILSEEDLNHLAAQPVSSV